MDEELEKIRAKKLEMLKKKMEYKGPVVVTDADFDEVIKNNDFVIVDFWAPWCGPCRIVEPILEEIGKKYAGMVTIAKLNVDENQKTAARFGVMGIPTMIFFKAGQMVERIVGAAPKGRIENAIMRHME